MDPLQSDRHGIHDKIPRGYTYDLRQNNEVVKFFCSSEVYFLFIALFLIGECVLSVV